MLSPRRKFHIGVAFTILIGLLAVLFALQTYWFAAGQGSSFTSALLPHIPNGRLVPGPSVPKEYQFSAPWDEAMYANYYGESPDFAPAESIHGGIVSSDLADGAQTAAFFEALPAQQPPTIVLIGANRLSAGQGHIITSLRDWKTPLGVTKADTKTLDRLIDAQLLEVNEEAIKGEGSLYSLVPFVAASLPDAKIIPLMVREDVKPSTIERLVTTLGTLLPPDAVYVLSLGLSNSTSTPVAAFHDDVTRQAIESGATDQYGVLDIDATAALSLFTAIRQQKNAHESFALPNQPLPIAFGTGEKNAKSPISLLHLGDIMLDRSVKIQIDKYGADYLLSALAGPTNQFFRGMQIVSANLEGPFANSRRPTTKEIAFRFDPVLIPMLARYNIRIVSQANNHAYDMSAEGFRESRANLTAGGIDSYGDEFQVNDSSYLLKTIHGKNIAFIGVNDTHAPVPVKAVTDLIARGEREADITLINIHWGVEYKELSNERQRNLARAFIDAGADAVIGHHPHWVQEVEIYRSRPIFYSLGNFIFDQYFSVPTQQGLVAGTIFGEHGISVYLFPVESRQSQVTEMLPQTATPVMAALEKRSRLGGESLEDFHFFIPVQSYK